MKNSVIKINLSVLKFELTIHDSKNHIHVYTLYIYQKFDQQKQL
jgi:hypothetical protein